jgi:hypothetical protein
VFGLPGSPNPQIPVPPLPLVAIEGRCLRSAGAWAGIAVFSKLLSMSEPSLTADRLEAWEARGLLALDRGSRWAFGAVRTVCAPCVFGSGSAFFPRPPAVGGAMCDG